MRRFTGGSCRLDGVEVDSGKLGLDDKAERQRTQKTVEHVDHGQLRVRPRVDRDGENESCYVHPLQGASRTRQVDIVREDAGNRTDGGVEQGLQIPDVRFGEALWQRQRDACCCHQVVAFPCTHCLAEDQRVRAMKSRRSP